MVWKFTQGTSRRINTENLYQDSLKYLILKQQTYIEAGFLSDAVTLIHLRTIFFIMQKGKVWQAINDTLFLGLFRANSL